MGTSFTDVLDVGTRLTAHNSQRSGLPDQAVGVEEGLASLVKESTVVAVAVIAGVDERAMVTPALVVISWHRR